MSEPVYELPDLPRAPPNPVGDLARQLLERGDLTAVQPLLDALVDAGRDADARRVKIVLITTAASLRRQVVPARGGRGRTLWGWERIATAVSEVAWFDMFDLGACLRVLEPILDLPTYRARKAALDASLADLADESAPEYVTGPPAPVAINVPPGVDLTGYNLVGSSEAPVADFSGRVYATRREYVFERFDVSEPNLEQPDEQQQ